MHGKYLRFLFLSIQVPDEDPLLQLQPELPPGSLHLHSQGKYLHLSGQLLRPYVPEIRRLRSQFRQDLHISSEPCQDLPSDLLPAHR